MAIGTSGIIALVGAGVGAAGSQQQGKDAKEAADKQADILEEQAAREKEIAALEARDFTREQSRVFAERRANLGASGVDPSSGTALLSIEDFAAEVALQADRIKKGGQVRSSRLEQGADLQRDLGRNLRNQGFARAGSTLLQGFANSGAFGG